MAATKRLQMGKTWRQPEADKMETASRLATMPPTKAHELKTPMMVLRPSSAVHWSNRRTQHGHNRAWQAPDRRILVVRLMMEEEEENEEEKERERERERKKEKYLIIKCRYPYLRGKCEERRW